MSDQIFYVGSMDDHHPLTGYVPAKAVHRTYNVARNGAFRKARLFQHLSAVRPIIWVP